ncbi:hypothetical protein ACYZT4_10880 [Pseudomonas sp. GB2N2]
MPDQNQMLELIFTAEILTLAKAIRAEKIAKNGRDPGDCVTEAVRDAKVSRENVMRIFSELRV